MPHWQTNANEWQTNADEWLSTMSLYDMPDELHERSGCVKKWWNIVLVTWPYWMQQQ